MRRHATSPAASAGRLRTHSCVSIGRDTVAWGRGRAGTQRKSTPLLRHSTASATLSAFSRIVCSTRARSAAGREAGSRQRRDHDRALCRPPAVLADVPRSAGGLARLPVRPLLWLLLSAVPLAVAGPRVQLEDAASLALGRDDPPRGLLGHCGRVHSRAEPRALHLAAGTAMAGRETTAAVRARGLRSPNAP